MDSPVDSTAVIRMRKDFNAFISDSGRRLEQPSFRLNFDAADISTSDRRRTPSSSNDSIKAILEKEKQEKLKVAELLAAKSKIAELETQLASVKTSNKRARIEFEKDLDSIKSERERESDKITELRCKVRQLADSEQLAKAELAEGRQEWETARISLEKKLRNAQREKLTMEEELMKLKEESWQQLMEQKQESGRCQSKLEMVMIELEETKAHLKMEKGQVEELTDRLKDYEDLKKAADSAKEKIKDLEEQVSRQAEDAAVTRAMRGDIEKVPGLEKEVTRLRTENEYWSQQKQNAMLLQEQLTSVQRKLETAEKRCETLTQLQVEHEDLKGRLQRWEAMDTSGSRRPQSPSELSRRVKELQVAEAVALEQKGQLQSSITVLELRLREAVEQQKKTQGEMSAQKVQVDQQNDLIKRLRRKLLLVTKERDSFKRILDSYESEMTVTIPGDSRVKDLQEVLEGFQQHNNDLETQVEHLTKLQQQAVDRCLQLEQQNQASQSGSSASMKADQDKICRLQEQLLDVEQQLKKVTEEKDVLEMKIEQRNLQGDYDPRHTKVLHLSLNPASLAQQQREREMERLKEENERLTTRVQLLEKAGGPLEDLTMQVDKQLETVPESKTIQELKSQLAKEELRKQRLVEAFKKTSQEFRETCYQLLGYKIDMPCTGQYRLASMYSESPHDYLLFKQGQSGEIQMLETDFSGRQQDKLETYLQNRDSIPALLSAITLDLFSQQTLNMG
ncbi:mitotic spindle assembly checkpoint protein MAD1-like [Babylonia areolata]|uniref:mitotic spindle assembly checkpoint protein MAD1-like n=1 Tax=Babylonia areolata TaxID=304850 RepID=UPI003FD25E9C